MELLKYFPFNFHSFKIILSNELESSKEIVKNLIRCMKMKDNKYNEFLSGKLIINDIEHLFIIFNNKKNV